MIHSESIAKLAEALSKAQGEMDNPSFDSVNPHYKSKYASLASVRNAVIPELSKNGIGVIQELTTTERGVKCSVILIHSSGEWAILDPMEVPATKADAQGYVSAATYVKRTTLQAAACVVGEEDDDGNAVSQRPPQEPAKTPPKTPENAPQSMQTTEPVKDIQALRRELDELAEIAIDAGIYNSSGDAIQSFTTTEKFQSKCRGTDGLTKEWQLKNAINKARAVLNAKNPEAEKEKDVPF